MGFKAAGAELFEYGEIYVYSTSMQIIGAIPFILEYSRT